MILHLPRVTLCHQGFISPWKLTGHTYRTLGQFYSPCLVSFDSVFTLLAINMYLWLAPFVIGTTAEASHGAHIKAMTPTYTQSLRSHAIPQRFFSPICWLLQTWYKSSPTYYNILHNFNIQVGFFCFSPTHRLSPLPLHSSSAGHGFR